MGYHRDSTMFTKGTTEEKVERVNSLIAELADVEVHPADYSKKEVGTIKRKLTVAKGTLFDHLMKSAPAGTEEERLAYVRAKKRELGMNW